MRNRVAAALATFLAAVFVTLTFAAATPASAGLSPERRAAMLARQAEEQRTLAVPTGNPTKWSTRQFLSLLNSRLPVNDNNKVQVRNAHLACAVPFFSKRFQLTAANLTDHPVGVFGMEYIKAMQADMKFMLADPVYKAASATQQRAWVMDLAREWMRRFNSGVTLVTCISNWDSSVRADGSGTLLGFNDTSLLNFTKVNWRNPLVQSQLVANAITVNFARGYMPELGHLARMESELRLTGTYNKAFLEPSANSARPNTLAVWGQAVTIK